MLLFVSGRNVNTVTIYLGNTFYIMWLKYLCYQFLYQLGA